MQKTIAGVEPVTERKLYRAVATILVMIKRQMNRGEIVLDLKCGRRVKLVFMVEEPKIYLCRDEDGMKEG